MKRMQIVFTSEAWNVVEDTLRQTTENFDAGSISTSDVVNELVLHARVDIRSLQMKHIEYRRPNFKLIREYFVDNLKLLIQQKSAQFTGEIKILIEKSTELRTYFSRISPRQIKYTRNMYASASLIRRRT